MATSKLNPPKVIPADFQYPFKRVAMEERWDDSMACLATVSGQSLDAIKKLAYTMGLPKVGPIWPATTLIGKIGAMFGLSISEWREVGSVDALPPCAFLCVDVKDDYGRFVVWTHFRGDDKKESMNIVCDVGSWIEPKSHITRDYSHLRIDFPLWYLEVAPKVVAGAKAAALPEAQIPAKSKSKPKAK